MRINTNVSSLMAQQGLDKSQSSLNTDLQRLSTGLRINSGADDPAGYIASQGLQSEVTGITQAINNSQLATNVIATAEGALNEVSSLLLNIQQLVNESANSGAMSQNEIEANQLEVDSAVNSITRISNTTTFAGQPLLNGSLDYITSGVSTSAVKALQISQANFGTNATIPVDINVVTSARQAGLDFANSSVASSVTLQISGNNGVNTLTFVSGTAASAIAFAINRISSTTGVTASLINSTNAASGIVFNSTGYGSQSFVSVTAQTGNFTTTNASGSDVERAVGRDVVATVNGALTVGNGLQLEMNTSALCMNLTLASNFGAGQTSFTITGGGALFQLGAEVNPDQQADFGIQSVAASKLGNNNVGFLSDIVTGGAYSLVGGGATQASQIVTAAITQIADMNGELGAFQQNTLQTNMSSLNVALENVTAAESSLTNADFASETSNMTRDQILVQAGTSVLATANSTPQMVLKLLGGS